MKKIYFLLYLILLGTYSVAQVQQYTLAEVVQLAREQSIASKQATTQKNQLLDLPFVRGRFQTAIEPERYSSGFYQILYTGCTAGWYYFIQERIV